jgi:hypothetical protein
MYHAHKKNDEKNIYERNIPAQMLTLLIDVDVMQIHVRYSVVVNNTCPSNALAIDRIC